METKLIGQISNNLEIVRKVVESRDESTKKVFKDIINGDDVKTIVTSHMEKLDTIGNAVVEMGTYLQRVTSVVKKSKMLMSDNSEIVSVLKEISANVAAITTKTSVSVSTEDVKKMLKDVLGDVQKDNKTKTLLASALISKDIVENFSKIAGLSKLAKSGVGVFENVMFGDGKTLGLIGVLMKIKENEKNIPTPESFGKYIDTLGHINTVFGGLVMMSLFGKLGKKGVGVLDVIMSGDDKNTGLIKIMEDMKKNLTGNVDISGHVQTMTDLVDVAKSLSELSVYDKSVSGIHVLNQIVFGDDKYKGYLDIVNELKKYDKNSVGETTIGNLGMLVDVVKKTSSLFLYSKFAKIGVGVLNNILVGDGENGLLNVIDLLKKNEKNVVGVLEGIDKEIMSMIEWAKQISSLSEFSKTSSKGINVLSGILFGGKEKGLFDIIEELKKNEKNILGGSAIENQINVLKGLIGIAKDISTLTSFVKSSIGIRVLNRVLFGDGDLKGVIDVFKELKKNEKNIASSKTVEAQVKMIGLLIDVVKRTGEVFIYSKLASMGVQSLYMTIIGEGNGLLDILKAIKDEEKNISVKGVEKQIVVLNNLFDMMGKLAGLSLYGNIALNGVKVLNSVICGDEGLLSILKQIKDEDKNVSTKSIEKQIVVLNSLMGVTKDLSLLTLYGNMSLNGVHLLSDILFGDNGLIPTFKGLKEEEKNISIKSVDTQVEAMKSLMGVVKDSAFVVLYGAISQVGVKLLNSILLGEDGLVHILIELKKKEKEISIKSVENQVVVITSFINLVKEISKISLYEKLSRKGLGVLDDSLFGTEKNKGIVKILEDLKKQEKNGMSQKDIEKQVNTITSVVKIVVELSNISKLGKSSKSGLEVLDVVLSGKKKTKGLIEILKEIKSLENMGLKKGDVDKHVNTLMSVITLVSELSKVSKLKKSATSGVSTLDVVLFGKKKQKGLVKILEELAKQKLSSNKSLKSQLDTMSTLVSLVKELTKLSVLGKLAKMGVKTLDGVLFGKKTGLVKILEKIDEKSKSINKSKKSIEGIASCTKSLITVALTMSAMVVLAIPATLGAVMTAGFVWVFLKVNKQLLENDKEIQKGNKVMSNMMIGLIAMGASMILMYKAVENADWEDFGMMAASIVVLAGTVVLMSSLSKNIDKGADALLKMGLGYVGFGVAMMLMFKSVEYVEWEDFALVAATTVVLGGVVILMSVSSKNITKGADALVVMALGYVGLGLAMMIMYKAVQSVEWNEFALLAATTVVLGGVVVLMSTFSKNIEKGINALLVMSVGYLLLGTSLLLMFKAVQGVEWNEFALLAATTVVLGGVVVLMSTFSKNIDKGSNALLVMGMGYLLLGTSLLLMYKAVTNTDWEMFLKLSGTVVVLAGTVILMSTFSKNIDKGSVALLVMAAGYIALGLSIMVLYKTISGADWEKFALLSATTVVLAGTVVLMSIFSKNIEKGTAALLTMSVGYVILGLSMLIMYKTVANADWNQFGMLAATVVVLGGVVVIMGALSKMVEKGAAALVVMGIGYTLLGISMMLMYKAVAGADWEKFGMMIATVGSLALVTALMGIPIVAACIALGSVAMVLMAAGLAALAMGIWIFGKLVSDNAIDKVATGIPKIIKAMTSVFESDKENPSFGDGVLGIILGALKLGGAIFAAGALMLIGISLGVLALCLRPWENLNKKSIDNVEYVVGKMNTIFKLDNKDKGGGMTGIGNGIIALISSALKFGETFFQMGTILLCSFTMGLIYDNLKKWANFNTKSIDNFEKTYKKIREIFKLDDKKNKGPKGLIDGTFELICSMLSFGKTFFQMGSVLLVSYTMGMIYDNLSKWKNFDMGAIDNFSTVYEKIKEIFKLDEESDATLGGLTDGFFEIMSAVLTFGATFFRMGTILMGVWTMDMVREHLEPWSGFDTGAVDIMSDTVSKLCDTFGLNQFGEKVTLGSVVGDLANLAVALIQGGATFIKLGTLLMATVVMEKIVGTLDKWSSVQNISKAMDNLEYVIGRMQKIFGLTPPAAAKSEDKEEKGGFWSKCWGAVKKVAKSAVNMVSGVANGIGDAASGAGEAAKLGALSMAAGIMGTIIDNITKMSNIKDVRKVIDDFENAVNSVTSFFKNTSKDYDIAMKAMSTCDSMMRYFVDMAERVAKAEKQIVKFCELTGTIQETLSNLDSSLIETRGYSVASLLRRIFSTFDQPAKRYHLNVNNSIRLFKSLESLQKVWDGKKVNTSFETIVDKVNSLEIDKASALTDMFKSFANMSNKNIFSSFKDSVDMFTNMCIKLVDAINGNTNALENQDNDSSSTNDSSSGSTSTTTSSNNKQKSTNVNITNIDDLAQAIAQRIGSGRVSGGVATVDLRINGQGGDSWTIRRGW